MAKKQTVDVEQQEVAVKLPDQPGSWSEQGKIWGKRVHDAINKGEMLARDVALVFGAHLGKYADDGMLQPSAMDFINAYVSEWRNPNVQKSRKTEIKVIFEAFAVGDKPYEATTGYDKANNDAPIKETKPISEWLKNHSKLPGYEGFKGLQDLARTLRDSVKSPGKTSTSGANRGPRKVTDKQQGEIESRIEVMNHGQASTVVQRGLAQLSKLPPYAMEIEQFRVITMACDQILNRSSHEASKNRAQALRDMAADQVDKLKVEVKAREEALKAGKPLPAPTPPAAPEAPKAEGETTAPAPAEQKAA